MIRVLFAVAALGVAVCAQAAPSDRVAEDPSDLPEEMFTARRSTFSRLVSQRTASEVSEVREMLAPILPVRGMLQRGKQKGLLFDRIVIWEGESVPGSILGVHNRLFTLSEVSEQEATFRVQDAGSDTVLSVSLPISLRSPLFTP